VSKLPVVSGAECVKARGKIGFVVYRQRGSHLTMVRKSPSSQTTIPNHREIDRGTLRDYQAGRTHGRRVYCSPLTLLYNYNSRSASAITVPKGESRASISLFNS
jgi:predicted RNA binding protein YcfA (HicA-like mRNA interferase family)